MRGYLSVFVLGVIFSVVSPAASQPAVADFYYVDDGVDPPEPPLTNGSDQPIQDEMAVIQVMHDLGQSGPDVADSLLYSFPINGEYQGFGAGYFATPSSVVVDSGSIVYLAVPADGRCWHTVTIVMPPGYSEFFIEAHYWVISEPPCPWIDLDFALVQFVYCPEPPDPELGCPCVNPTPFSDATMVCYFDDINLNGPDEVDTVLGWTASSYTPFCWTPETPLLVLDPNTGLHVFVRVFGVECCWTTIDYIVAPGTQDVWIVATDWSCEDNACPQQQFPLPSSPFNAAASTDECMQVTVTWDHDGLNVAGFNVYTPDSFVMSVWPSTIRSARVLLSDSIPHAFRVIAVNAAGESTPSDWASGAAELPGIVENFTGSILSGSEITVHFGTSHACSTLTSLVLLVNDAVFDTLCTECCVSQLTCTLPSNTLLNCRLLLSAQSVWDSSVIHRDTSACCFNLIPNALADGTELPRDFTLTSVYPNPFNSSTRVEFALPVPARVEAMIFNLQGQHVSTLTDDNYSAGTHSLKWDARAVSSGIYLLRLRANGEVQTQKLLLLR